MKRLGSTALLVLLGVASLRCSENVEPSDPAAIGMVDGNNQTGPVGQPLPDPLVVLVTDDAGDPVSGVTVSWTAQGGGSVSASTVSTDADGRASVTRLLGEQPGQQNTIASVGQLQGSPVTFVAIAVDASGPSLTLETQPSSVVQSGAAFAVQPVIQLKDSDGNNLAQSGLEVTAALATGTGTLGGATTSATNASGTATFTNLSITGAAGSYSLRFTAPGVNPVISSSITVGGAAGSISITTNPPVSALDAEVFAPVVQPVVQVKDASGTPIGGVEVTARIASGSGTLEGSSTAFTDASGIASFGGSWDSRRGRPHARVYYRHGERYLIAGLRHGPTGRSEHRKMGIAGRVGYRAPAHEPDAEREDFGLG